MSWYGTILGAVERAFAIIIQIALSVLVLQVFIRSSLLWLFLAFTWHAAVDATAVVAADTIPPSLVEVAIGLFAAMSLLITFILQTPESNNGEDDAAVPLAIETITISSTSDNIGNSRYD